jgi:hypothetical protein
MMENIAKAVTSFLVQMTQHERRGELQIRNIYMLLLFLLFVRAFDCSHTVVAC